MAHGGKAKQKQRVSYRKGARRVRMGEGSTNTSSPSASTGRGVGGGSITALLAERPGESKEGEAAAVLPLSCRGMQHSGWGLSPYAVMRSARTASTRWRRTSRLAPNCRGQVHTHAQG